MTVPDFKVETSQVIKKSRKPGARFNVSGKGPLLVDSFSDKSSGKPRYSVSRHGDTLGTSGAAYTPEHRGTPQTRSANESTQPKQFGKHRASAAAKPSYDSSRARGRHAKGAHAKDYNFDEDMSKSRANTEYSGAHAERTPKPEGKHGRAYNASAEISRHQAEKRSGKTYIPKHTAEGQAQRAEIAKQAARQASMGKLHKGVHSSVHKFTHVIHAVHGKHWSEHMRLQEQK